MTQHRKVLIEMKISLCLPKEPNMNSHFRVSPQFLTPHSYSPFSPSRSDNVILVLRRISPWEFYWSPFDHCNRISQVKFRLISFRSL